MKKVCVEPGPVLRRGKSTSVLHVISIGAIVVAPSPQGVALAKLHSHVAAPRRQDAAALELLADLADGHFQPDQLALALRLCHDDGPFPRRVLFGCHYFLIQGGGCQDKRVWTVHVQRSRGAVAELQPGTDEGLLWEHDNST